MAKVRKKIEALFEALACFLYKHKLSALALILIIAALLAIQVMNIKIDTSTEGFLHEKDPILLDYESFRDQFGREEVAMVVLKSKKVFDKKFINSLKALHDDLEKNLPYLEDVTSLINARNTCGNEDELIVEDLFETMPGTKEELLKIEKRAKSNQMYKNLLLSEDGLYTSIVIKTKTYSTIGKSETDDLEGFSNEDDFLSDSEPDTKLTQDRVYLTDQENSEFVKSLEEIVDRHRSSNIEIYIAGTPIITDFLKRSMMSDMGKFMKVALVTIAIFLMITFRRFSGVVLPILIVIVSLLSTIGLMAIACVPIKIPTQILPSFLLSVAVGASVHLLVIFFQHFDQNGSKKDALIYAMGHSGLPILMTSLTTAGGLMSFSTAEVAPIADLGLFASAGVLLSLFYTIILLPVLLAIIPLRPKPVKPKPAKLVSSTGSDKTGTGIMDKILNFSIKASTTRPITVLLVFAFFLIIAASGIPNIRLSHDPVRWLPDTPGGIRQINEKIDKVFKGTTSLEVIVDTKKKNGLYEPEFLNKMEAASEHFEKYDGELCYVGKAWSITSVLKESNQALHENNPAFYTIPENRNLIAQEFFLFENSGSDDLEDFTDSQFSKARFTIKMPFVDAIAYSGFIEMTEDYFKTTFPESDIKVTGMIAILTRILKNALYSMMESYIYAFIVITILMVVLIGNAKIGIVSMIPNLYPIVIMLGIMGWFGLPMDLFTMLIGSIAIGLAVDDTIHFMHNFRGYYEQYNDAKRAVHETLHTTGRAMLVTTCVLSIGFFTFMFAGMNNLFNFGLLTGIALITALLSDYFIAPALMMLMHRKQASTQEGM